MSQTYYCPRCRAAIPYHVNVWMPWQINPLFRCQHCATLLQRVHSVRSTLTKISIGTAFFVTEAAAFWLYKQEIFGGDAREAFVRISAILIAIFLVYLLGMRLATHYRLIIRSEE